MPKLIPLNDYVLVELIEKWAKSGLSESNKDEFASIQKGICIDVGEALYRSKGNWVLDEVAQAQVFTSSELRQAFLTELTKAKKMLIGETLYWEMYADKDTTFELEDGVDDNGKTVIKKYALIKLAQICAMETKDDKGNGSEAVAPAPVTPNGVAVEPPKAEAAKPTEVGAQQ
jgi:hypothetical protein